MSFKVFPCKFFIYLTPCKKKLYWTNSPHYYKIPPLIALILALNSAFQALRKPPL